MANSHLNSMYVEISVSLSLRMYWKGFGHRIQEHGGKFPRWPTAVFPLRPQPRASPSPAELSNPHPAVFPLANRGAVIGHNWLHQLTDRRHASAGYGDLKVCMGGLDYRVLRTPTVFHFSCSFLKLFFALLCSVLFSSVLSKRPCIQSTIQNAHFKKKTTTKNSSYIQTTMEW